MMCTQTKNTAEGRSSRMAVFCRLAPASLLLAVAGCAGLAPTADEIDAEDRSSKYSQTMRLADTVHRSGDPTSAAIFFGRAHALAPDRPEALAGFAETAAAAGAYNEAAEAYRRLIQKTPGQAPLHLAYGRILLILKRPDLAADQFQAVIRLTPKDARGYNGLGIALNLLGQHQEAQRTYLDGIEITPDSASLRNNLALSLALDGQHNEAIEILQEIASEPGIQPQTRLNLALAYALAGRLDLAEQEARAENLPEAAVRRNLTSFARLRTLQSKEVAAFILRRSSDATW
jgi:Flp pilus assembly protein TadD